MKAARSTGLALLALLFPHFAFAAEDAAAVASDHAAVVEGSNAFAVELYNKLKDKPGNLFFSPESISIAMAMLYAGARGETAAEIAKVLHFTLPPVKLHPAMGALLRALNGQHEDYQLRIANGLWVSPHYTLRDSFVAVINANYNDALHALDVSSPEAIDSWVAKRTDNTITHAIPPGAIIANTNLVIANVVYFKGDWDTQFKNDNTKDDAFYVARTKTTTVPLMHRTGAYNYFDGGTFQALELPYKHKELSMVVFLPKALDGLPSFEHTLTPSNIHDWLVRLRPTWPVIVTIPRFKLMWSGQIADALSALEASHTSRLERPHLGEDFSGMGILSPTRADFISAIIHTAYVTVNEKGTEAAASTIVANSKWPSAPPLLPTIFDADHPFLFVIRDNKSGSILFIGRISNPSL